MTASEWAILLAAMRILKIGADYAVERRVYRGTARADDVCPIPILPGRPLVRIGGVLVSGLPAGTSYLRVDLRRSGGRFDRGSLAAAASWFKDRAALMRLLVYLS